MIDNTIIYLLDDEPELLKALSRLLNAHGFETETFRNARDFFQRDRTDKAACLVLDLAMPDLNGLEMQQRLNHLETRLPIVFLTAHGDIPTSVRAMKAGAEDFLVKPVDSAVFLKAVHAAIRRAHEQQAEEQETIELRKRLIQLTPRQREVLEYVIAGKLNKVIAAELGTGEQNIKVHRRRLIQKMGVKSVAELVRMAEQLGVKPAA